MNVPNMIGEVLEAVHLMYEDYPDVETDCMVFLANMDKDPHLIFKLHQGATQRLLDMGRCPTCGNKLEYAQYAEVHDELPERPIEYFSESYCPKCDLPKGGE